MRSQHRIVVLGLVGVALLAMAGPAASQTVHREGRTLEFKSDLPWSQLSLHGDEVILGVSPLRVPGPLVGDFWLVAQGPGVESQRGRVRVGLDEAGSRLESYGSPSRHERLMRALLFPGYAQFRAGERGKGIVMAVAGAGGVASTIWAQTKLWDADDNVAAAQDALSTSGVASEREALRFELLDAQEEKSYASNRRSLFLGATAAVWGVSAFDALAFGPGFHVTQADEASLTLAMRKKSRRSAMLRAVMFPGLGQEYNGRHRKALVLATGGIGVAAWYVKAQDDYNRAVSDFDRAHKRYVQSTNVDERAALLEQQHGLFANVDSRQRVKGVAFDSLAGLWILSLLDSAIDFGGGWGGSSVTHAKGGLGLYMDPNGVVGAQVRF